MFQKVVMSIGQCFPDHLAISQLFNSLGVQVEKIDSQILALNQLKKDKNKYSLVLINRKLDIDYSDGIELLKKIKEDPEIRDLKVMIVSNYKDIQEKAVEFGAIYGFGKSELDKEETKEKIQNALKQ